MMPSGGWLTEAQNISAPVENIPLPIPFTATYADSNRRGSPSDIIARIDGQATAGLSSQTSTFTATLTQLGTEGAVLIDRIE